MRMETMSTGKEEVMMGYIVRAYDGANMVGKERGALNPVTRIAGMLACIALAIAVCVCTAPASAYAADAKTASETYYVAGSSDGHLWAKDTIEYDYLDGKVVSEPTVKQQASAICEIQEGVRGPVYGCYFKYKDPTVKYSKDRRTVTVKTYWVCKQGLSIKFLDIDWHKTCTVTYTCDGDGQVTVTKKLGKLQLG